MIMSGKASATKTLSPG